MVKVTLYCGDNIDSLKRLAANSVDSIVTDPPYGLSQHSPSDITDALTAWIGGKEYLVKKKGFMGKCVHPDTDVLTESGWKKIGDVGIGELVASLNPVTKVLEYVPVVSVHTYPFSGNLYDVGGRSAKQRVTPNHNVWVGTTLTRADSLPPSFFLTNQSARLVTEKPPNFLSVAGDNFPAKAFMSFFGLWLGDGYVCERRAQPEKQDFIGLSVKKPRKVAAVRKSLEELGVKFTKTPDKDGGCTAFYVYHSGLREWLRPLGKAHEKYIPQDILHADPHLLDCMFDGLIETDGTVQGNGQIVYSTSSSRLADDFQTLLLHIGLSGNKTVHREEGIKNVFGGICYAQTSYRISVARAGAKFWMLRKGRLRKNKPGQPPNVALCPYTGNVNCVTLERNHIMMTRWEGAMCWTGNSWDSFVPGPELWKEVFRVLKPGGHILCFAGSRTDDLMGIALRLAGFEVRDKIMWIYGTGFPKSLNVAKAIEATALTGGSGPQNLRKLDMGDGYAPHRNAGTPDYGVGSISRGAETDRDYKNTPDLTTAAAKQWDGWGTALKPTFEPIIVGRKPLGEKTVAANVLKHGTGGINVDACRVALSAGDDPRLGGAGTWGTGKMAKNVYEGGYAGEVVGSSPLGRFPANVIHDGSDEVEEAFAVYGQRTSGAPGVRRKDHETTSMAGRLGTTGKIEEGYADTGLVSRFFYSAKASKADRADSKHPTVKPVALMRYLVRLVTPPNGTVLDPFAGSGTTGAAAVAEGFNVILMERETEYQTDIEKRFVGNADVTFKREASVEPIKVEAKFYDDDE